MSLAALLVFATACSDDAAGPGSANLSVQEAADVAEGVVDALDGILDGEIGARPLVAPDGANESGIALSSVPVVTEFSWNRSRECRNGGTVSASGSGTHTADRETRTVTLDFEGSKTITDCARARGDIVITIDGQGTFEGHRMKVNGQYSGLQTNDSAGSFSWETSDGRSGECSYELHVEWNPDTHTKTVTGFVCDREINRTVTRDRSAGGGDDA
jgi:hypothetical protein